MEKSIDIDFIFSKAATIIKKHLEENGKRETSVVKFTSPTDLLKVIDFSLPSEPESHEKLLEYAKKVLEYSIQAGTYITQYLMCTPGYRVHELKHRALNIYTPLL